MEMRRAIIGWYDTIAWMAKGDTIYEDVLCGNHHTYVSHRYLNNCLPVAHTFMANNNIFNNIPLPLLKYGHNFLDVVQQYHCHCSKSIMA